MKTYQLVRKALNPSNNGIYNFCPYCLKDFERKNQNKNITYKEAMDPLFYVKNLIITENKKGETVKELDEHWECNRCHRCLTSDDWLKMYCVKPDGSRFKAEDFDNERVATV